MDVKTEEVDLLCSWFVLSIITEINHVIPNAVEGNREVSLPVGQSDSPRPTLPSSTADPIAPTIPASTSYVDGNTTLVLESRYRDETITIRRPMSSGHKPTKHKKKSKKRSKRSKRSGIL